MVRKRYFAHFQNIDISAHEKRGLIALAFVVTIAVMAWVF